MSSSHFNSERNLYLKTYLFLVVLLICSLFISHRHWSLAVLFTLTIIVAVVKTYFIMVNFMHLREEGKLVKVFSFAGLLWLFILIHFTLNDYATR